MVKAKTGTTSAEMRVLSAIAERLQFATTHGMSHSDKRDLYDACGYTRTLTPKHFWDRYRRNGVARCLVNVLPAATWRAGAELVEDDDPQVVTPFEEAWLSLQERLQIWDRLRKADVLAQLGRYSVLLIGAPGALSTELNRLPGPDAVVYLKQYSERDVTIQQEDLVGYPFTGNDTNDPRFGLPKFYQFTRLAGTSGRPQKVHWSRVIHVADEAIEDDLYGESRLASVWNWLDDLEKVAGAGSEAFWRRVVPLLQAKLQPGTLLKAEDERKVEEEIDKWIHGLRRYGRTFGIDMEEVGSTDVANFGNPIDALIGLIVAVYGIPKRILSGSERGELASDQDRSNWEQQVKDRRSQFAETVAVRPLVQRLILYGALPPVEAYETRWPAVSDLSQSDKLSLAKIMAEANAAQGQTIMTTAEIRDGLLGLEALEDDEIQTIGAPREVALRRLRHAKAWEPPYRRREDTTAAVVFDG